MESINGRECYGGLDLSSTSDITALVLVFPPMYEGDNYIVYPHFWLSEATLEFRCRRDHVLYDVWKKQGYINTTEGNPVLRWMAQNVVIETDPAENIKPTKAKSIEKIDGIVAMIMALDRCVRNAKSESSVYDNRGILVL